MDKISIKNLEVYANHGVFPEETSLGQKFIISAVLYVNIRQAGLSDDLTESIHYGEVSLEITRFMKENTYKLLETVVERLAEHLLLTYPLLQKVSLELMKPWAPIGLPLKTVSVSITRGWHRAWLALGSNLGDKEGYLRTAVDSLRQYKGIQIVKVSDFIVTKPYGGVEQDDFLNGCMEIRTLLPPFELLAVMQKTEQEAHRERLLRWGPRTLDLDMLYYDDEVVDTEVLTVPHPEIAKRDFVLKPLYQIAPLKRDPLSRKTVKEMLEELENQQN